MITEEKTIDYIWMNRGEKSSIDKSQYQMTMKDTVHFYFNEAIIVENDIEKLDLFISKIELDSDFMIEIIGHTDTRGSEFYNLELSLDRAIKIRNYMTSEGVDRSKLQVNYYGESKLAIDCIDDSCPEEVHFENRRSEIFHYKKEVD